MKIWKCVLLVSSVLFPEAATRCLSGEACKRAGYVYCHIEGFWVEEIHVAVGDMAQAYFHDGCQYLLLDGDTEVPTNHSARDVQLFGQYLRRLTRSIVRQIRTSLFRSKLTLIFRPAVKT